MRCLAVCLATALTAAAAPAHFFYLVPDATPGKVRLVFADGPAPDPTATMPLGNSAAFKVIDRSGTATPTPVADATLTLSGPAAAEVVGLVPYGVVLRGGPEPVLIVHHPRLVLDPTTMPTDDAPLSVRPAAKPDGSLSFRVTAKGKPLSQADVILHLPGEPRTRAVATGADGTTPAFGKPGRYAARVMWLEKTPGEHLGRKYAASRHYATVVVDHAAGPERTRATDK